MTVKSEQVTDALKSILGVDIRCPMCANNSFSILQGYIRNDIQPDLSNFVIGGASVPTVAIVCNRCGFLSQHAVGVIRPETLKDSGDANEQ